MAKLLWALICSRVLIDQNTNMVSYIDAIEQFAVPSVTNVFPPIILATLWRRDRDEERLRIRARLVDPNNKTVVTYEPDPHLTMTKPRHRVHVNLAGVPLAGVGRYHLVIEQMRSKKWVEEASVPVEVGLLEQRVAAPVPSKRITRRRS